MLEGKLAPKGKRRALRLTVYEAEIESFYEAAKRLQSRMGAFYMHQRIQDGILDQSAC
jgi:hypothetical protein